MENKSIAFLIGWAALIFGVYPMTKDLVDGQPHTVSAMVWAIIFSFFLVVFGFIIFSKLER